MIWFIFFIWFMGWYFSTGAATAECWKAKEIMKFKYVAALVILWPFYIGYSWETHSYDRT